MAEKGKIVVKKWDFMDKKWVIGGWKIRAGNKTRKAKWCKTQVFFLKDDKLEGVKN